MARSANTSTSQQLYSSSLAAYTLKQFSAAHAALNNDEAAAAKLPANVKTFGYHVANNAAETPSQPISSESPSSPHVN
ncbi:hypothetical protein C0993_003755 [Termitomyces sp. T159_Od127]|nr:hypothetical protein C0993_003755 [Termitomyces sp. T159_Od127]